MKEKENEIKKSKKEIENLKNTYLKKNTQKTNNFELSKLKEKKSTKFVSDTEFNKEELFKKNKELFMSKLTGKFNEMFEMNSEIFKTFQSHLDQRKQYLIDKIQNNEAKFDYNLMEEYDVL